MGVPHLRLLTALAAVSVSFAPARAAPPWDPTVISDVAERVTPAVVSLTAPAEDSDERPEAGTGSGVIVRSDGLIVTSHHVVAGGEPIWAALSDGRRFEARFVGGDPSTDVAVVRIDGKDLPTLPLGDARALRLGELVLAVGNPFDVGQTVTLGIVSAQGRSSVGILDYEDFIQTDAAINPGNSGGALVNMRGELVGINTSIISRTGSAQGVGFAIPTHVVVWVRDQLLAAGEVRHGWLGVSVQAIEPEIVAQLGLNASWGVLVTEVVGAPARRAGLAVDDVITHVDGRAVLEPAQLRSRVGLSSPGSRIELTVQRRDRKLTLPVTLGESGWLEPAPKAPSSRAPTGPGIHLARLSVDERKRRAVPPRIRGWIVERIEPGSAADRSDLAVSDVVVAVGSTPLEQPQQIDQALERDGHAVLRVHRRGTDLFVVLRR